MTASINPDDIDTALYFIHEKGDVTRWIDWPGKREMFMAAAPELGDWMQAQRIASAMRAAVIQKLEDLAANGGRAA
jgi:hypothetical protein